MGDGSADANKTSKRAGRPERTSEAPPSPAEVFVKYRTGLPPNVSPRRQEAILRAHRLIEDLKQLYVRLWSVPEDRIATVLASMNRKAAALDHRDYEHRALLALVNSVAIGAEASVLAPRLAEKFGIEELATTRVPFASKLALELFRREHPEFASKLDPGAVQQAIIAFAHRAGRTKPTDVTKWKAMKILADQAGIWSPATESLKRSWAKRKSKRRQRMSKRRPRHP